MKNFSFFVISGVFLVLAVLVLGSLGQGSPEGPRAGGSNSSSEANSTASSNQTSSNSSNIENSTNTNTTSSKPDILQPGEADETVQTSTPRPENQEMKISIQKQIYILAGTLGGVLLLLIFLVLAVIISLVSLRSAVKNRQLLYIPEQSPQSGNTPPPRQGFDNRGFGDQMQLHHEMQERRVDAKSDIERMGYTVYNGKQMQQQDSRYANPSRQQPTMMRAEESVTSYSNDKPDRRTSGYRY